VYSQGAKLPGSRAAPLEQLYIVELAANDIGNSFSDVASLTDPWIVLVHFVDLGHRSVLVKVYEQCKALCT
jgi:hypothetical protein